MSATAIIETINRERAVEYQKLVAHNRPLNQGHVRSLTERQQRGEWIFNGDTIRFDSEGVLRDGQHRLEMVIRSGQSIDAVVVRGLEPEAFITMDTGRNRNLADILAITGYANSKPLASALAWVHMYLRRVHSKSGVTYAISHELRMKILAKHQSLVDSVSFYLGLERPEGAPKYHGQTIGASYLFGLVSPEAAKDFTETLVTGLHLSDASDPVHRLREQLVANMMRTSRRASALNVFDWHILAWNAKQAGRLQKVAYKSPQTLPAIHGFPKDLLEVAQMEWVEIEEEEEQALLSA